MNHDAVKVAMSAGGGRIPQSQYATSQPAVPLVVHISVVRDHRCRRLPVASYRISYPQSQAMATTRARSGLRVRQPTTTRMAAMVRTVLQRAPRIGDQIQLGAPMGCEFMTLKDSSGP